MASSSSAFQNTYDVFLSFRGEDTRHNFTGHLYAALSRRNIVAFLDERLHKGDEISPTLIRAIEGSRISIVVFSQNYASSICCLEELVKITECKNIKEQIVIPIYYKVDPADVRKQKGSYHYAFAEHEKYHQPKVLRWKMALYEVANLSGWDSAQLRYDYELVEKIVGDVLQKLNYMRYLPHQRKLVGINKRIAELELLLCTESDDVIMVGIWGMGGIGKTTLAKVMYDQLNFRFQAHSFVENLTEYWNNGNHDLRNKLLTEILGEQTPPNINSPFIVDRLSNKKTLIVLDDVSQPQQIEDLVGKKNWYGPGSRIIVTTRDKSVLYECDRLYEVKLLDSDEAHQLFCMHAFQQVQPKSEFIHLTDVTVHYARGLPLALKVLGLHLHSKNREEWESALQKMKEVQDTNIHNVLKVSHDEVDLEENSILSDSSASKPLRKKN